MSASATLWAAVPGRIEQLHGDACAWLEVDGPARVPLAARDAAAWAQCAAFAPIEQHELAVANSLQLGSSRARRLLQGLIELGLLRRPEQMLARSASSTPPPVPLLLLRDQGSPRELAATLEALAAHRPPWLRERELVLLAEHDATLLRARATALAAALDARIAVLDATSGARALAAELLDPRHGDAAILNWALLLGAGGCVALLDARGLGPAYRSEASVAPVRLLRPEPAQARSFDLEREPALDPVRGDPLAAATARLGELPLAWLHRAGLDLHGLLGTPAHALLPLRAAARVAAVACGTLDDAHAAHGVDRPTLVLAAGARVRALDARSLLPFAIPVAGDAHTAWAGLLQACEPSAAIATLPLLLRGEPTLLARDGDAAAFLGAHAAALGTALRSGDVALRLEAVGGYCADLALADDIELLDVIKRWHHLRCSERAVAATASTRTALHAAVLDQAPAREMLPAVRAALATIGRGARTWPALWHHAHADRTAFLRDCGAT